MLGIVTYPYFAPISAQGPSAFIVGFTIVFFGLHLLCAFWLLGQAVRFEAKPLPYLVLAFFVPFACIWYYTKRVRERKQIRSQVIPASLPKADHTLNRRVRRALWIGLAIFSVLFAVTLAFFYPFSRPFYDEIGTARYAVEPILTLIPFGAMWMLYQAIRYEPKPLLYVLLALFVPFACVWYYIEKARTRQATRGRPEYHC
jgi:hypothetical protein